MVINWKRVILVGLFCSSLLLDFLGVFRITWFGQLLDDVFHRLLFGWLKYLYFSFIIFWYINTITRKGLIAKYWPLINKKKLVWGLFNLFWTATLIGIAIEKQSLDYSAYNYSTLFSDHIEQWKAGNVWEKGVNSSKAFFAWRGVFSAAYDNGGLIGLTLTGWTTYLHIIGAFTLNLLSWFFLSIYFIFNHPFFMFLSKKRRQKFYWDQFNKKRSNYFEPSTISQIDEKEVTIQIPIERRDRKEKPDAKNPPRTTWSFD